MKLNPTIPLKSNWKKDEGTSSKPRMEPFKAKVVVTCKDKGKIKFPTCN